jgi:hypothetical protein
MKAVLAIIPLLLVGCSGVVQAQEGETDPQIAALTKRVAALEADSALLRERISQLESDPLLRRMKRLATSQELVAEATAIARLVEPDSQSWNPQSFNFLVSQVQLYGPPYAALTCLEGAEPTLADFRVVVTETYGFGVGPGGMAQAVLQQIDNEIKRLNSSNEAPSPCLKSYLYPEFVADAGPAIELYLASVLPSLPARFRDGFQSVAVRQTVGWFNDTDRQQPFIIWMCEQSSDRCGLPAEGE